MALSKRLFSLYQMVEKGSVVADIGCDHGLLPISLVQDGICDHSYACDLRKGPLSRAQEAIEQCGLQDKVITLLRNGIDDLPSDVDTIVIAGMGFDTIKMILEANAHKLSNYSTFIIQSNKHVEELRHWISEHHFTILQEDLVEEDHFYQILKFSCTKSKPLSEHEILFGRLSAHPLFQPYWRFRLDKIALILKRMPNNHCDYKNVEALYKQIEEELATKY